MHAPFAQCHRTIGCRFLAASNADQGSPRIRPEGSELGFRGERFGLSWEGIRAIVENHSCFRGSDLALGREGDSGFRGGRIHEFNRASLRQQSQLEVIGSTKAKIYCKKKH